MLNKLDCLCVPGMNSSYSTDYIGQIFSKFGQVKYIAEIPLKNNPHKKRVVVWLNMNRDSSSTKLFQERFSNNLDIQLSFNGDISRGIKPWLWKVTKFDSRSTRFIETYLREYKSTTHLTK